MNKLGGITTAEAHVVSLIIQMRRRPPETQKSEADVSAQADRLYQDYLKKFVVNEEVRRAIEDYLHEGKELGQARSLVGSPHTGT